MKKKFLCLIMSTLLAATLVVPVMADEPGIAVDTPDNSSDDREDGDNEDGGNNEDNGDDRESGDSSESSSGDSDNGEQITSFMQLLTETPAATASGTTDAKPEMGLIGTNIQLSFPDGANRFTLNLADIQQFISAGVENYTIHTPNGSVTIPVSELQSYLQTGFPVSFVLKNDNSIELYSNGSLIKTSKPQAAPAKQQQQAEQPQQETPVTTGQNVQVKAGLDDDSFYMNYNPDNGGHHYTT
ncbi:MAG: hypothetical protein K5668_09400 [Lachnospiraceae bacterium]|nr:hypothetical protein [Lachnospiraceae bacterium]